jgi:hypothetical protein
MIFASKMKPFKTLRYEKKSFVYRLFFNWAINDLENAGSKPEES